jgi:hypothetical protein
MYIIYRIVGIKVGCTINFELRCIQNKLAYGQEIIIEILDTWPLSVGDKFAGDREWEWADAYGYLRGPHYSEKNWNVVLTREQRLAAASRGGKIGGKRTAELGKTAFHTMTFEQRSAAGKIGSNHPNNVIKNGSAHRKTIEQRKTGFQTGKASRSPNHITKKLLTCPNCGHTGVGPSMYRWHYGNCK